MSELIDTSVLLKEELERTNEMIKALATELENTQETNVRLQKAVGLALISLGTAAVLDRKYVKKYTDAKIDLIKQLIKGV